MKKATQSFVFAALMLLAFQVSAQATKWTLDKSHAKVGFSVSHMLISDTEGYFRNVDASFTSSKADFSDAVIEFTAQIASVNTDNEGRDGHLQKEDWFDAAKFPTMTFKSTSFVKGKGKTYILKGNLTMHGVTKPVTLTAIYNGTIVHPFNKKTMAGFKITGKIKRTDFGVGAGTGNAIVGEEVTITANVEFEKN
jgi:polyisoprenoid-binding protein YceI